MAAKGHSASDMLGTQLGLHQALSKLLEDADEVRRLRNRLVELVQQDGPLPRQRGPQSEEPAR